MKIERYQLNDIYSMRIATFDEGVSIIFPAHEKAGYPGIMYGYSDGSFIITMGDVLQVRADELDTFKVKLDCAAEAIEAAKKIVDDLELRNGPYFSL